MPIVYGLIAREKTVLAEHTATSGNFPTVTRVLLAKIPSEDGRMSYVYDQHVFHYIVQDKITFLCMTDEDFQRRVPFAFLEDMKSQFLTAYGDRGQTAIAFAMNDEFQNVIRRLMDFYNNNTSSDSLSKVQQQIDGVKEVMVENIEKVLERGEKIELLVDRTDKLNQQAFRFERKSKHLRRSVLWQNMKRYVFFIVLFMILLYLILSSVCGFDLSSCHRHDNAFRWLVDPHSS